MTSPRDLLADMLGLDTAQQNAVLEAWAAWAVAMGFPAEHGRVFRDLRLDQDRDVLPPGYWWELRPDGSGSDLRGSVRHAYLADTADAPIRGPTVEQLVAWRCQKVLLCPHGRVDSIQLHQGGVRTDVLKHRDPLTFSYDAFHEFDDDIYHLACYHHEPGVNVAAWWPPSDLAWEWE